ncbi:MAG: hypothetical protein FWJ93_10700 [Micromonosporaceae bacterium]
MRGKLMFLGGLAVGYVLGTREGRERYEQLMRSARKVADHPTVQEARGVIQAQASRLYAEGKEALSERFGGTKLGERMKPMSTGGDAKPVEAGTLGGAQSEGA